MAFLFDAGLPILLVLAGIVGPIALRLRRRAAARRHFQYEVMYRGSWIPFFIPFLAFGAVKRPTIYAGKCRTCGLETPPEGAGLPAIARHARSHDR